MQLHTGLAAVLHPQLQLRNAVYCCLTLDSSGAWAITSGSISMPLSNDTEYCSSC